ncbi:uncharacterized protein LODBEIA_P50180 [Lodderomyces beijingensis]|uniref:Major facilitator superfamily (MFS) profile domain-containing protein n=1 Tax=Lodderomyces beijingensis TaxID=1775926 RepID=A0ABP0ZRN3_9ASCO
MLEYFANYGSVLHISGTTTISGTTREPNDKQWQVTLIPKFALPFLILSMSIFFAVESPRWLVRIDRNQLALRNLAKLRNLPIDHPYVLAEISDINEQVMVEKQVSSDSNFCRCIKEIFTKKSIAYRFFMMGAMAQILGQWSGANAVTIYASKLFSLAGVKGDVGTLKMSAALGVVKFGSAYLGAFFLVDTLGRKKSLYTGLFLQLVSILYYAIFLTVVPQATTGDTWSLSSSQRQASKAALAAIFLSGVGWVIGANNTSYLLGSEIFPLHIRSFAQSLVMVVHFANQYGNSKALPKMMLAMHPYGAFYLFVGDLVVYLIWAYFLPELKGRSLESIEKIFTLPWYKLRYSDRLVPDHSQLCRIAHVGAGVGITQQGDDADKELEFLQTIDKRASPPTMIENLAESESSDDKEKEREVV